MILFDRNVLQNMNRLYNVLAEIITLFATMMFPEGSTHSFCPYNSNSNITANSLVKRYLRRLHSTPPDHNRTVVTPWLEEELSAL